jgi:hypothetical protein
VVVSFGDETRKSISGMRGGCRNIAPEYPMHPEIIPHGKTLLE